MLKRTDKSFGPAARIDHDTLEISYSCNICIFRLFPQACRAEDPPRVMQSTETPDWCRYKYDISVDVEKARQQMLKDRAFVAPPNLRNNTLQ